MSGAAGTPGQHVLSADFWHAVLDGMAAQVCVLDESGTILAVNRAWRDFHRNNGGQPEDLMVGVNYLEVCRRAAGAAAGSDFTGRLEAVLRGGEPGFALEYESHSPGRRRWFMARVSRMEGASLPCIVVSHDEVTALELAREASREGERLLADLAAAMPGALFRLEAQPGGGHRFTYFSPGVEPLLGLSPARLCEDATILHSRVHPEDGRSLGDALRAALSDGTPLALDCRLDAEGREPVWIHLQAAPRAPGGSPGVWAGVVLDVTVRKRAEERLARSEATYRTLFETIPLGVVYQNSRGFITSANPAAQRILGLSLDQLQGRTSVDPHWRALREDGSEFPGTEHPAMVALRTGAPVRDVVMRVSRPDGSAVWITVNATPLFRDGALQEVYASFEDITERALLAQELRRQATTDELTGLPNRRSFMARLESEFQRTRRNAAIRSGVAALDLDHFKRVNDTWGHAAGDAVLRHAARVIGSAVRGADLFGRTGGEEFSLLLPDTDPVEGAALAERLRVALRASPACYAGVEIPVTVSIGLTTIDPADASVDEVLARADAALYDAKQAGRDAVVSRQRG